MTYNSRPNLWNLNKASAFIDAMNAANGSNPCDYGHPRLRSHVKAAPAQRQSPSHNGWLTPRIASAVVGLAIIAGITAANWIA